MYHPSKAPRTTIRDLNNYHNVGVAMSRADQSAIAYPFVTGGVLGWKAKDTDIPDGVVTDQRMSGPFAALWGKATNLI